MKSRMALRLCLTALALALSSPVSTAADVFDQKLVLQGITFHVTCPNDSSAPTLTITPSGLAVDNSAITKEVDGHTRQIQYKLAAGEAGWLLRAEKVVEY